MKFFFTLCESLSLNWLANKAWLTVSFVILSFHLALHDLNSWKTSLNIKYKQRKRIQSVCETDKVTLHYVRIKYLHKKAVTYLTAYDGL